MMIHYSMETNLNKVIDMEMSQTNGVSCILSTLNFKVHQYNVSFDFCEG